MERSKNEKVLGLLDKSKFLVPKELTMSQLTAIIRSVQVKFAEQVKDLLQNSLCGLTHFLKQCG